MADSIFDLNGPAFERPINDVISIQPLDIVAVQGADQYAMVNPHLQPAPEAPAQDVVEGAQDVEQAADPVDLLMASANDLNTFRDYINYLHGNQSAGSDSDVPGDSSDDETMDMDDLSVEGNTGTPMVDFAEFQTSSATEPSLTTAFQVPEVAVIISATATAGEPQNSSILTDRQQVLDSLSEVMNGKSVQQVAMTEDQLTELKHPLEFNHVGVLIHQVISVSSELVCGVQTPPSATLMADVGGIVFTSALEPPPAYGSRSKVYPGKSTGEAG